MINRNQKSRDEQRGADTPANEEEQVNLPNEEIVGRRRWPVEKVERPSLAHLPPEERKAIEAHRDKMDRLNGEYTETLRDFVKSYLTIEEVQRRLGLIPQARPDVVDRAENPNLESRASNEDAALENPRVSRRRN